MANRSGCHPFVFSAGGAESPADKPFQRAARNLDVSRRAAKSAVPRNWNRSCPLTSCRPRVTWGRPWGTLTGVAAMRAEGARRGDTRVGRAWALLAELFGYSFDGGAVAFSWPRGLRDEAGRLRGAAVHAVGNNGYVTVTSNTQYMDYTDRGVDTVQAFGLDFHITTAHVPDTFSAHVTVVAHYPYALTSASEFDMTVGDIAG